MSSKQAAFQLAPSNNYLLSSAAQGDVVIYTTDSNQKFMFGLSNTTGALTVSSSNIVMPASVTIGGNVQVPSLQFTVGGNIQTAPVVNLGSIAGYSNASYASSNVTTLSLPNNTSNDKFSFTALSNEVFRIQGNGNIFQFGQDIANTFTFRNRIINGDMRIDQRMSGASSNINAGTSNVYTVDRFNVQYQYTSGSLVYSQSNLASSDSPYNAGFRKTLRVQAGATAPGTVTTIGVRQIIEGNHIVDFNLGTTNASAISLSFWAKSSASGTHYFAIRNINNNTQSYVGTYSLSAANTWQLVQVELPPTPSGFTWNSDNTGGLELSFDMFQSSAALGTAITNAWVSGNYYMPTGSTNLWSATGNYLEITGVQLEKGYVNTPFEFRPVSLELSLCQRYFEIVQSVTGNYGMGTYNPGGANNLWFTFKVTKRVAPTLASGTVTAGAGTIGSPTITTEMVAFLINATGSFFYSLSAPLAYTAEM